MSSTQLTIDLLILINHLNVKNLLAIRTWASLIFGGIFINKFGNMNVKHSIKFLFTQNLCNIVNINHFMTHFAILFDVRTFKFCIFSKLKIFNSTRETQPTKRMFAVKEFIRRDHLFETDRTLSIFRLNLNIHNFLLNLIKSSYIGHDFNLTVGKNNFVI